MTPLKITIGTIINNRYEIMEFLGSGGMAMVYRTHDRETNRPVTLKIMRADAEEQAPDANMRAEAQSIMGLSHPHIVKAYEYAEADGLNYIAMEYVEGTTLKKLITQQAPFEDAVVLGVALQIADGLSHAHQNGVVHRDIKPQNILIHQKEDGTGEAKITDFGIARCAKNNLQDTCIPGTMGSAHYFSPEQARGGFVDHKTDIYALGIVIYEMATGRLPFDGENLVEVAVKHINEPIPNPQNFNPNLSANLCYIIKKATEKASANRYPDAAALIKDIQTAFHNPNEPLAQIEHEATVKVTPKDQETIREYRKDAYATSARPPRKERPSYKDLDITGDAFEEDDPHFKRKFFLATLVASLLMVVLVSAAAMGVYAILRPGPVETIPAPNIVGMPYSEAEAATHEAGLAFIHHEIYELSDEFPPGYIIWQSPEAGVPIRVDAALQFGVSGVAVPVLTNLTREDAEAAVAGMELTLEFHAAEGEFPIDNVVLEQDPPPGTAVAPHATIVLYVSEAAEGMVSMPALVGLEEAAAIVELQSRGLAVGPVTRSPNVFFPAGVVFAQSATQHTLVPRGQVVTLNVSEGPLIPETPDVQDEPPVAEPTPPPATPAPEPTAAPPTPTPEIEPTPTLPPVQPPIPPDQAPRSAILTIPSFPAAAEVSTVNLRIFPVNNGATAATPLTSFNNIASAGLPMTLPVSGTGRGEFTIEYTDPQGNIVHRTNVVVDFGS